LAAVLIVMKNGRIVTEDQADANLLDE